MAQPKRRRSSVGTLLILAAIDMLTASLVCAVVLFLVLVGSQSEEPAATSGSDRFNAPSIALIYFKGPFGPTLGNTAAAAVERSSHEDPLLSALLGPPPYSVQTYQIKGGEHQLVIKQSSVALLELYPGNGSPARIAIACRIGDNPVTVSFGRETGIDGSCAANDASPSVIYPQDTRIRFLQPDIPLPEILPDDWAPAAPPTPTANGGRVLTFQAKKTISSQELGASARIAEILK
jgi:hypothetical protein